MARLVNDIVARLYLASDWRDISGDVRAADGVEIQRGRKSEDGTTPPQTCFMTLDNQSGDYTERNPLGTWYGYLGRNTPLDVSLRIAKDTATNAVVGGWGSMDTDSAGAWTAYPWSTYSFVAAGTFAKSGGKATHTISTAGSEIVSYLDTFSQRDIDITMTFSVNANNITGNPIGVDFILRMQGFFVNYYSVRMQIETNESITLDIRDPSNSLVPGGAVTVPGITHSSAQALKVRVQAEGQTIRAKIWVATSSEPYDWTLSFIDYFPEDEALRTSAGAFSIGSYVAGGNTNVPVVFSYDDIDIRIPMYFGEVSEWPQTRDVSGNDRTVEIEASGIRRRLVQGVTPVQSAPRRFIPTDGQGVAEVQFYWPLEDGPLVTAGEAVVGDAPLVLSTGSSERVFGQGNLAPWLAPTARLQGPDAFSTIPDIEMTNFVAADGWMFDFVRSEGVAQDTAVQILFGTTGGFDIIFDVSAQTITIDDGTSVTNTVYPAAFDGGVHHFRLSANGAGTVAWDFAVDGEPITGSAYAGTLDSIFYFVISNAAGSNSMPIGHIAIYNGSFSTSALDAADAAFGFRGELGIYRMLRLAGENDIPFTYVGQVDTTTAAVGSTPAMGPQSVKTPIELLEECATADGGILFEPRGATGLLYRTRYSLYNQDSWATLSMADKELSPPWVPVSDDRYVSNQVTVQQAYGSSYTDALESGRMSILPPEDGGIGLYDDSVTLNLASDSDLPDQAAWRVHLGTVDEERYPDVAIGLHRAAIHETNPSLYVRLLDLDIGDQVTLADLDRTGIYDDTDQIVIGYRRYLSRFNHTLNLTCAPASAYRVSTLDDTDARLDSDNSFLDSAVSTGTTSFKVRSTDCTWTTAAGNMPIALKVGGEEVSATAIGSATPTFVGAGTAAHGNNASVVPGLPVGIAAGDLLLLAAAIRNTGTGVPVAPAGYGTLAAIGSLYLFAKVATSSESAPTVTFTGGVANATTTAQIAAFRGASIQRVNANGQTNASAQNIAYPQLLLPSGPRMLVIYLGWKQDDWTSVATISGATEIGEPSSTLGDDQGLVWDYQVVQSGSTESGSFVVTGGAAAVSIGIVCAQYVTQDFTVTRSVNGVVKSHAADARISLARPSYLGL